MKYVYFAQAYGQNAYGACDYQTATSCGTSSGAGTSGSGSLVNTGLAVATIVALACLIICISIVVRVWKRAKSKEQNLERQEVTIDEEESDHRPQ